MDGIKRKGGRPSRTPEPGERVPLGLRVTPELKQRLDAAAKASGRSQSQEAELRIGRSFSDHDLASRLDDLHLGREVVGFLMMAERAMTDTGRMVAAMHGRRDGWMNDPYAYDQAVKAFLEVVEMLRPSGRIPEHGEVVNQTKVEGKEAGLFVAGLVNDIAGDAPSWPLSEWGAAVRGRLGRIADRIPSLKPLKRRAQK